MGDKQIPEWQKDLAGAQVGLEERARLACMHRNAFKVVIRDHQSEKNLVQLRNQIEYNNPVGPSFEGLVNEQEAQEKTGDDAYLAIIEKAQSPNKKMTKAATGGRSGTSLRPPYSGVRRHTAGRSPWPADIGGKICVPHEGGAHAHPTISEYGRFRLSARARASRPAHTVSLRSSSASYV